MVAMEGITVNWINYVSTATLMQFWIHLDNEIGLDRLVLRAQIISELGGEAK